MNIEERLIQAIEDDELTIVRDIISSNPELVNSATDDQGRWPLMLAIAHQNPDMVNLLTQYPPIRATDARGTNIATYIKALQEDEDVDIRQFVGLRAYIRHYMLTMINSYERLIDFVNVLPESLNITVDQQGTSYLMFLIKHGYYAIIISLFEHDAVDFNLLSRNKDGKDALDIVLDEINHPKRNKKHEEREYHSIHCVRKKITAYALKQAIEKGDLQCVKGIVDRIPDHIVSTRIESSNLLQFAVNAGQPDILRYLLTLFPVDEMNTVNNEYRNILDLARHKFSENNEAKFAEMVKDIEQVKKRKMLEEAIAEGRTYDVEQWLQEYPDEFTVIALGDESLNPILYAMDKKQWSVVKQLLKYGAVVTRSMIEDNNPEEINLLLTHHCHLHIEIDNKIRELLGMWGAVLDERHGQEKKQDEFGEIKEKIAKFIKHENLQQQLDQENIYQKLDYYLLLKALYNCEDMAMLNEVIEEQSGLRGANDEQAFYQSTHLSTSLYREAKYLCRGENEEGKRIREIDELVVVACEAMLDGECSVQEIWSEKSDEALEQLAQRSPSLRELIQMSRDRERWERDGSALVQLQKLQRELFQGGIYGNTGAEEYEASDPAYEASQQFIEWWNRLTFTQQRALSMSSYGTRSIKNIMDILLSTSLELGRNQGKYCVNELSKLISNILSDEDNRELLRSISVLQPSTDEALLEEKKSAVHRELMQASSILCKKPWVDVEAHAEVLSEALASESLTYDSIMKMKSIDDVLISLRGQILDDALSLCHFISECCDNDLLGRLFDLLSSPQYQYLREHSIWSRYYGLINGKRQKTSESWARIEKQFSVQMVKNAIRSNIENVEQAITTVCNEYPFIKNNREYYLHIQKSKTSRILEEETETTALTKLEKIPGQTHQYIARNFNRLDQISRFIDSNRQIVNEGLDNQGNTLMMLLVKHGEIDFIHNILVVPDEIYNPEITNHDGKTVLDICLEMRSMGKKTKPSFRGKQCDINVLVYMLALSNYVYHMQHDDEDSAKTILEKVPELLDFDNDLVARTILHYAVKLDKIEFVRHIVKRMSDSLMYVLYNGDKTALELAELYQHDDEHNKEKQEEIIPILKEENQLRSFERCVKFGNTFGVRRYLCKHPHWLNETLFVSQKTPIQLAHDCGHYHLVNCFANHGAQFPEDFDHTSALKNEHHEFSLFIDLQLAMKRNELCDLLIDIGKDTAVLLPAELTEDQLKELSMKQKLDLFLTYKGLVDVFSDVEVNDISIRLAEFFAKRVRSIRATELDYFHVNSQANTICLNMAREYFPDKPPLDTVFTSSLLQYDDQNAPWHNYLDDCPELGDHRYIMDTDGSIHNIKIIVDGAIERIRCNETKKNRIWVGNDFRAQDENGQTKPLSTELLLFLMQKSPSIRKLITYTIDRQYQAEENQSIAARFVTFANILKRHSVRGLGTEEEAYQQIFKDLEPFITWWNALNDEVRVAINSIQFVDRHHRRFTLKHVLAPFIEGRQYEGSSLCADQTADRVRDMLKDHAATAILTEHSQAIFPEVDEVLLTNVEQHIQQELDMPRTALDPHRYLDVSYRKQEITQAITAGDFDYESFSKCCEDVFWEEILCNTHENVQRVVTNKIKEMTNNQELFTFYQRLQRPEYDGLRQCAFMSPYFAVVNGVRQKTSELWAAIEKIVAKQVLVNYINTCEEGREEAGVNQLCRQHAFIGNNRKHRLHFFKSRTSRVMQHAQSREEAINLLSH